MATLEDAIDPQTHWVWSLDGSVEPQPGCLAELTAAAERLSVFSELRMLCSLITTDRGVAEPSHAPLLMQGASTAALETVSLNVLPVRAASGGSLLIAYEAWRAFRAHSRWPLVATAHLCAAGGGYLVPASIAIAKRPARSSERIRLLAPGVLRPRERMRLAGELLESLGRP